MKGKHEVYMDNFHVKESTIENAGNGLFASQPLPQGYLLPVTGVKVQKDSEGDICTRYARDYRFLFDEGVFLVPTGWAGMANHSQVASNAVLVKENDTLYLKMTRPIGKDEEILYEYSDMENLRINLRTSGQAMAVVAEKDDKMKVSMVTVNVSKAMKQARTLQQDGWKVAMIPTKIDLNELKGSI